MQENWRRKKKSHAIQTTKILTYNDQRIWNTHLHGDAMCTAAMHTTENYYLAIKKEKQSKTEPILRNP